MVMCACNLSTEAGRLLKLAGQLQAKERLHLNKHSGQYLRRDP